MDASLIFRYFPHINQDLLRKFELLADIYSRWNQKINVISRKDIDQLYLRHVLHSLAIAKVIEFKKGSTILDVGTGGGFPGIPLAILFPDVNFHLVDSIGKKIGGVEEISRELGLANVRVEQKRAENVNKKYDFVVSRAVTQLDKFIPWVRNNIDKENRNKLDNGILYLKGGGFESELKGVSYTKYLIRDFFDFDFFEQKFVVHIRL